MHWRTWSLGSGWLVAAGLLGWIGMRSPEEAAPPPSPVEATPVDAQPDQTAKVVALHEQLFAAQRELYRAQARIQELETAALATTEAQPTPAPPLKYNGHDPREADLMAQYGFKDREALNRTLKQWVIQEPEAATEWLNANARSAVFDDSIHLVSQYLVDQRKYEMAYEWAASIRNGTRRQQAVTEIYAAAYREGSLDEKTLEGSGLPERVVASIERGDYFD